MRFELPFLTQTIHKPFKSVQARIISAVHQLLEPYVAWLNGAELPLPSALDSAFEIVSLRVVPKDCDAD